MCLFAVRLSFNCSEAPAAGCLLASARFLFRSRVEKKLAHLARHTASDGSLLRPCKCLIQIGGFQYPESTHVLLGLGVRPVSDQHPAVGLLPHRLRLGGRGNAAGELPGAGSDQFEVERVNLFHHFFGNGRRIEVVGKVVANQILWHRLLLKWSSRRFVVLPSPYSRTDRPEFDSRICFHFSSFYFNSRSRSSRKRRSGSCWVSVRAFS